MPTFSAGGLASGLDTNTLIDSLATIRGQTVTLLKSKQSAFTTQVSVMGGIVERMNGLKTAATGLGTQGTLGIIAQGSLSGLSVAPTSAAQAGNYSVQVTGLAAAAKSRSLGFTAGSPALTAGNLDFSVNGTAYSATVNAGASLAEIATSINSSVSAVSAVVLSDGTSSYLSITNRATGFTIGGSAANALQISGTAASQFGFASIVPAANAHISVDGLDFERRSNTFSDVLPGVTMTASTLGPAQDLVLSNDTTGTAKNVQGFIDAYNLVLKSVQAQLSVSSGTNRSTTLAGDGSLRGLQGALQSLTAKQVGSGTVRTLADLGVKTARDGTLSLDSVALDKAITRDPAGVNSLFNTAATGISAVTTAMVDGYTNSTDGVLVTRTKGIQGNIARLGKDIEKETAAVDRYRELLVKQFTAMENIVSSIKSTGNYLTSQENAANRK